jgi:chorismate synthase
MNESVIQEMLDRRRPGESVTSTSRKESDTARILSGVFEGQTTGTPISIMVENQDAKSSAYNEIADIYRPGHGDYTYQKKYGIRDWRGGGRSSARETVGRVAAGAVANAVLTKYNIEVVVHTIALGSIKAETFDPYAIDKNMFLCADIEAAKMMEEEVARVRQEGDSLGGIVEIIAKNVPPGLGEPVFDKLDADLAKAMMSIGAVKGVEIGSGFHAAGQLGSQNNDPLSPAGFLSNNAGGILAGISNGDEIVIRVAVKPIPSISIEQKTVNTENSTTRIKIKGRHDISAIPRINVVCEAMVNLVLVDHLLRQMAMR